MIKYLKESSINATTEGDAVMSIVDGYVIFKFLSSGSISFLFTPTLSPTPSPKPSEVDSEALCLTPPCGVASDIKTRLVEPETCRHFKGASVHDFVIHFVTVSIHDSIFSVLIAVEHHLPPGEPLEITIKTYDSSGHSKKLKLFSNQFETPNATSLRLQLNRDMDDVISAKLTVSDYTKSLNSLRLKVKKSDGEHLSCLTWKLPSFYSLNV